jgi:HEAT repeat protein
VKILEGSLPFPQFRIGVAEQLAYLAEPRALKILDDVRADPKALPSEKARAAIALGWAGRADVAPALRELLAETRDNAYAAAALANLKDPAARPVLEQQLGINTLRVRAARGLRQLAPDADVGPLLQMLVGALESEKDTVQVEIAEAILLLSIPRLGE